MNKPPVSNPATFDERGNELCLEFDQTTIESAIFRSHLPRNYSGLGITASIEWTGDTALTTGAVVWGISFERRDTSLDFDADSFASEKTVTSTTSATSGAPIYAEIAFTNGAEIDSLSIGEEFRLKIRRVASDGADTLAGDAQLWSIELRET
jgi:hypothetical protein